MGMDVPEARSLKIELGSYFQRLDEIEKNGRKNPQKIEIPGPGQGRAARQECAGLMR